MIQIEAGLFTVGVFQDVTWAQKGLQALQRAGFPPESLTIMAKETPEVARLIQDSLGTGGEVVQLASIGAALARGPLVGVLQGASGDLGSLGLVGTMRKIGFQSHDGRIFDTLTGRGGVLVAIKGEARAADALAILHSYGGGNAAIGAWGGRV
jgi:hypothetical protein